MSRTARAAAGATLVVLACAAAGPGRATEATMPGPPAAPVPSAETAPAPVAGPIGQPCKALAARYGDGKRFDLAVTRAGQVRIENPLRPLTPEVNQVLQVVIAGKVATAYGPDFGALRRGGTPAAVESMLGAPIRWQAELPTLPDPIAVIAEDGAPLAELAFRTCEAPPAVKAPPQARKGSGREGQARAARKTPPGFSMPQGAIAE